MSHGREGRVSRSQVVAAATMDGSLQHLLHHAHDELTNHTGSGSGGDDCDCVLTYACVVPVVASVTKKNAKKKKKNKKYTDIQKK